MTPLIRQSEHPMDSAGDVAASLLGSHGATPAEICEALQKVLDGGDPAAAAFSRGFGPRRLLKLLARGVTDEDGLLEELADGVIKACSESDSGDSFATTRDFGDLHQETMYPDQRVQLCRPLQGQGAPQPGLSEAPVPLWLPARASSTEAFVGTGRASFVPALGLLRPPGAQVHFRHNSLASNRSNGALWRAETHRTSCQ